jgi:hypothetical protein
MGLKGLVRRVGLDRQREEDKITANNELNYYEVLSSLLKYNRLKLIYEKTLYDEKASAAKHHNQSQGYKATKVKGEPEIEDADDSEDEEKGWVPDLRYIIDALDKMSFKRIFASIEVSRAALRFNDIVIPLELYKEMIVYLRILLESSSEGHHEIAVAQLYLIFYTSQERQDPLSRLLSLWSPGTSFYIYSVSIVIYLSMLP